MNTTGKTDLTDMLKTLKPEHNPGDFVFCVIQNLNEIPKNEILMQFKEKEGLTVIIRKELADTLKLDYSFIAGWITLTVHSSLTAVGLTAAVANALTSEGISCNVVAAFYHDHIFVAKNDVQKAMNTLIRLSNDKF
jgi:uncharacterized protein